MRPVVTDAQQWRGLSIHAAYFYRRAAVVRSVHPRGYGTVVEQLGGQCIGFALLFQFKKIFLHFYRQG